ncbi:MAG: alpha/beta hydrolase [Flavobacteriia bacterium]|nr:alpha/beta hydrolase [Flavobacteriia bacterium]NCT59655.1 alpha/beta hydrolase [Flavobacteriia bacterium]
MKLKYSTLIALLFSVVVFSQEYTLDNIKLWDKGNIPLNKDTITSQETFDEAGMRYKKISEPALYVYRNKTIKNNGAALLFFPGGGYSTVVLGKNHGEEMAQHFLKMGFNVVAVLKYRLPDTLIVNSQEKVPLCDAQKAVSIVHKKASNWSVNSNKIAVMGASAGGHLAASLGNLKNEIIAPEVNLDELKIAVSILMYPVISFNLPYRHKGSFKNLLVDKSDNQELLDYYSMENKVNEYTPPTFIIHALDDQTVVYQNSLLYCDSLKHHNVKYNFVELEKGGHGFGLNFNKTGINWTIELESWLKTQTDLFVN